MILRQKASNLGVAVQLAPREEKAMAEVFPEFASISQKRRVHVIDEENFALQMHSAKRISLSRDYSPESSISHFESCQLTCQAELKNLPFEVSCDFTAQPTTEDLFSIQGRGPRPAPQAAPTVILGEKIPCRANVQCLMVFLTPRS